MTARVGLAVAIAWTVAASPSGAQPAKPEVALEIAPCVGAVPQEVRRVVALELRAHLAEAPVDEATRVRVGCAGRLVELHVDDLVTGKSLSRTIGLRAAAAPLQSRLLALAIAELVLASWTEIETNPRPAVPPATPLAPSPAREAARAVVRDRAFPPEGRLRLVGQGGLLRFAGLPALLVGGGLRIAQDLPYRLGWFADLVAHHGLAPVSLGTVSVESVATGAGVGLRQRWPGLTLAVGVGLRGGAARLAGHARAQEVPPLAASFWAPWGGPMATLEIAVRLGRHLVLDLHVEGGYVVTPIGGLVDGVREVAVDGAWVGLQLGVGIAR